jgi:hypothetical protein
VNSKNFAAILGANDRTSRTHSSKSLRVSFRSVFLGIAHKYDFTVLEAPFPVVCDGKAEFGGTTRMARLGTTWMNT